HDCVRPTRCNSSSFSYRPLLGKMNKIGLSLLAGFLLFNPATRLAAQTDDPSEIFLKAYMTSQQGEKLEHDNQFGPALAKYRFAGSLLEELRKTHADWQPAIVEYRARKIGESILRIQSKASTQKDLVGTNPPTETSATSGQAARVPDATTTAASAAPTLPQSPEPGEPSVELVRPRGDRTGQKGDARSAAPTDAAIKDATKQLRDKVDQLQAELQKSRKEFSAVQKEKENLNGRLQDTNSKLEKAQAEIEKAGAAEKEVRFQLAQAQESLKKNESAGGAGAKGQEALRAEIAGLKKAVAAAEQGRASAEKEKEAVSAKLDEAGKQIAAVTQERNELIAQMKAGSEAQQHVQALVSENSTLKKQLADAEITVREISDDKPKKEQEIADVKRQIEQLQQQIAAKDQQNKDFEITVGDLRSQLEEANSELNKAKLTGANTEETARLTKENEMLRSIVVRERQEEARREQAKKLMITEFEKLQIKSATLNQQVELLAQPVTKLTPEELALLRQPVVAISDSNPAALKASFALPKPAPAGGADAKEKVNSGPAAPPSTSAPPKTDSSVQTMPKPGVPDELVPVAREAKTNFDNGKYRAAEKQYQQILAKSPNNLYTLSNLGVVYFRTGKLKAAELTLKKAVTLDPKDEFSHRTLGIVYYSESKFDDAVTELTKALAINPKSPIAHNYLGITASQKGWQEAAEKEMLDAIAANPDYADAHYNLAVIYATQQPPSKEQAKLHYAKATSLGAESDPSLEKLLR
ncbi:MAG: tetratricopeptide repeat protein, partial [Verrucomicrobiota bacterium]|nr:tetratricopeptide repeat protein [Verrucomicrobiota bacterium]